MRKGKIAAVAALGLAGVLAFTGCSSRSDSSSTTSPTPVGSNVLPPVIVTPDQTTAEAKVGDTIVFNVEDPENAKISTDNEAVLSVMQGGKEGEALMNPGATALAPGTAVVAITDAAGAREVTVTVK